MTLSRRRRRSSSNRLLIPLPLVSAYTIRSALLSRKPASRISTLGSRYPSTYVHIYILHSIAASSKKDGQHQHQHPAR